MARTDFWIPPRYIRSGCRHRHPIRSGCRPSRCSADCIRGFGTFNQAHLRERESYRICRRPGRGEKDLASCLSSEFLGPRALFVATIPPMDDSVGTPTQQASQGASLHLFLREPLRELEVNLGEIFAITF